MTTRNSGSVHPSELNTHLAHPFTWKRGVRFYQRLKAMIAARPELQQAA
jgi:hypothetical protein